MSSGLSGRAPRVLYYDDPAFDEHDAGPGHPERPERLVAVRRGIEAAGLRDRVEPVAPRDATRDELLRVHTADHVDLVAATAGRTVRFDPDTAAGPRSYAAALRAAGAVTDAVDRVLDGGAERAFCAVRPPGHHALADTAMGFCLFNNVAVAAAEALRRGLERVLIIDWDVHHGNGTQDIFEEEPRVLYLSSHAFPFYPGTGALDEVGRGPGRGFTVNLPMPHGSGDGEYARVYEDVVAPIAQAFDAQLVLVSAGFDPHVDDPLAGMQVTPGGFAVLTRMCLEAAAGAAEGRTVVTLEGGYDEDGIAASSAAVVATLLGEDARPVAPARGTRIDALVDLYRRELAVYWPILA